MNLSMKWLADFVKPEVPVKQYAADLTMSGSKVEGYEVEGETLKNIVVGKVLSIEKHAGADTLFICKVDVNSETPLQIVTGAANVVAGAFVPVALDGSVVAGGKAIRTGKLRGELSEGMLCSLSELGLTKNDFPYADEDGIFLLGDDCELKPGLDIHEAIGLNDTVVEFEITSNRPDCLSVIGLARETAATYGLGFSPKQPNVKAGGGDVNSVLSVTVENPELCLRYAAAAVKNVKIASSPRWLRERLRASGVRPINNIVDITNYVMLEYGQPLHAFDLKHVAGAKIIVRNAKPGEHIMTLDGVTRTLSPDMLVICDEKNPSAVAGVMGGEHSGVYDDTQTVIFESACFKGPSVRLTSKKLGLRTESSSRFEKGLDPENCMPAVLRACELVEQLGAGDICDGVIDCYPVKATVKTRELTLNPGWVREFLGADISDEDMVRYLKLLGFGVDENRISVPTFRADVEGPADLAEEIARLYGYNNIPATQVRGAAQGRLTPVQSFERELRQIAVASGYSEIITYSFISPKDYFKAGLPEGHPLLNSVRLLNPLGEDTSVMRTTAVPSMLETLARNYNYRNKTARLFEIATTYLPREGEKLPYERKVLMFGAYGGGVDFYTIKGVMELIFQRAGVTAGFERKADHPVCHPGRCAAMTVVGPDGKAIILGNIGEVHPRVAENYGIEEKAYIAYLYLDTLFDNANLEKTYRPLPKFPASMRDLALSCAEELPVRAMQDAISNAIGSILESLELFDIYRGKQVGEGKKSAAFSLTLRAADRTLTDEECDAAVKSALDALKELGAEIRS